MTTHACIWYKRTLKWSNTSCIRLRMDGGGDDKFSSLWDHILNRERHIIRDMLAIFASKPKTFIKLGCCCFSNEIEINNIFPSNNLKRSRLSHDVCALKNTTKIIIFTQWEKFNWFFFLFLKKFQLPAVN